MKSILKKCFKINKDTSIYGSFAEIGAGQETAHSFFKAGLASKTIAKSMSAYDMVFSDIIYGKQSRYVCKDRLITMLDHEYQLLQKRLRKTKGQKTKFFAFATTAATSAQKNISISKKSHAWMGLRFQTQKSGISNDIILHVNCLDKTRLQQHEALGILGVNLIYASFYYYKNPTKFISSLLEGLTTSRIEVNNIHCSGPSLKNLPNLLMNKKLLERRLAQWSFFSPSSQSLFLGDVIFNKSVLLISGNKKFIQDTQKKLRLKKLSSQSIFICHLLYKELSPSLFIKEIKKVCKKPFYLLIHSKNDIKFIKKVLYSYNIKKLKMIRCEKDWKDLVS
ncbi:MAG: hypothetical protein ACR2M7_00210 [Bdellovibrionales bacterium]